MALSFEFRHKNYMPHTLLKNYNCLINMSSLMYVQNRVTVYDTACQTLCKSCPGCHGYHCCCVLCEVVAEVEERVEY